MLEQPKSQISKVKLKPSQAYRETVAQCKKLASNPRISKLDQVERDGVEASLQTSWKCKIDNLRDS